MEDVLHFLLTLIINKEFGILFEYIESKCQTP